MTMKKITKKILTIITLIIIFLLTNVKESQIYAAGYPSGCLTCQTAGSWCGHQSGAYACVDASFCGYRVANSSFCPTGCTCGSFTVAGGNWCTNNCIKVEWCPGTTPQPTPTSYPTPAVYNNSECGPDTFPTQMIAGQSYKVSLTMHNTGTKTWRAADNYKLGSEQPVNNNLWGLGRVEINPPIDVVYGTSNIFYFTVTAPITPGHYSSRWRMVEEWIEWFGPTCGPNDIEVIEECPECQAVSLSSSPANIAIGDAITFNFLSTNEQGDSGSTDSWGEGVSCSGNMVINGTPKIGSKICAATLAGTYAWTHNWFSDDSQCRTCSQSTNYIVTANPKIEGQIEKNHNNVSTNPVGGVCAALSDSLPDMSGDLSVWAVKRPDGAVYNGTVWHDGANLQYSIETDPNDSSATYDVYLDINSPNYDCSCPQSTTYGDDHCEYKNITYNVNNLPIHIKEIVDFPWWLTYGGNAYAAGELKTEIPSTMSAAMMMAERNMPPGIKNTAGFPISKSGPIVASSIHIPNTRNVAINGRLVGLGLNESDNNYEYFMNMANENDETIHPLLNNSKPSSPGVWKVTGTLTIDESDNWNLGAGEDSIVVFVDGNMLIRSTASDTAVTSVARDSAGILMFIVKGDIIIDESVGYDKDAGGFNLDTALNTPLVEGMFVANGSIKVESSFGNDLIFAGSGNFIGWHEILLERDLGDDNTNYAVNNFSFRPDFITKFPKYLKNSHLYRIESSPSF